MPNGNIHARSSETLAVRNQYPGSLKRYQIDPVSSGSSGGSAGARISYFLSEYIRANLIIAVTVIAAFFPLPPEAALLGQRLHAFIKRTIDVIGALAGLILTSPLFIILPILIRLDSPGPIFYRQLRVGLNRRQDGRRKVAGSTLGRTARDRRREDIRGCPIRVIKFRTMVADAERRCGPVWATRNDPRITRFGNILRKTRLDEVPQFINVLKGEMSLVGPRPERPAFVANLCSRVEDYDRRLLVKPGITGLAQVENGYDSSVTSVVRKVHYDLTYIQNWSIWQDIKILLKTVVVVVTGKGAF